MKTTLTQKKTGVLVETNPAENVTNDATRTITDAMMAVGDNYAQGDIYFVRIRNLPKSAKPRKSRQLAEGDTQGSRHICAIGDVYDCDPAEVVEAISAACGCDVGEQYVGPVVRTADGVALVEHPEHGDHRYDGDMVLACVFQRSLDAEEREQRVRD